MLQSPPVVCGALTSVTLEAVFTNVLQRGLDSAMTLH